MERVPHPGQLLKTKFLEPLDISAYQLAKSIGVHVSRVSKIIKGERMLTADTATRLGLYFGVPAHWWMDMQTRFELDDSVRRERLQWVVTPLERAKHIAIGPGGVRFFRSEAGAASSCGSATISEAMLAMLEAQAELTPKRGERKVKSIEYGKGYKAIIGAE